MPTEPKSRLNRKTDRRPLYERTAEALSRLLENLEPGTYLPSEPKLARQLGVSRATLREAMRVFEGRGLIVRRQGVGTVVMRPPQVIETGIEALESIETLAGRIGLEVEMGELALRTRPPSGEERDRFGLADGVPLAEVSRVMLAGNRPIAYLIDALPEPFLPEEILNGAFRGSVLDLLLRQGDPGLSHSHANISAVSASPEVARYLGIQRGDVLLSLEAWLYTTSGEAVDHSYSFFLPGTFRFHVVRRISQG